MKIFTITLIDDGQKITAQADYTGEPGPVFDLGLEILSELKNEPSDVQYCLVDCLREYFR